MAFGTPCIEDPLILGVEATEGRGLEIGEPPKRKNPPEGGFFGGSRDFESLLWNLVWCGIRSRTI